MAGFDRGNRGGGGGGFKPRGGGFRSGNDRPKEMHDATCSSCGNACQVPFRPTGDKPVFCRDCFAKQGGGRELGRQAGDRGNSRGFEGDSPRYGGGAPMRSSAPYQAPSFVATSNAGNNELKKQLEQINVRLERLILAVQALAQAQQSAKLTAPVDNKSIDVVLRDAKKSATKKATKKVSKKQ